MIILYVLDRHQSRASFVASSLDVIRHDSSSLGAPLLRLGDRYLLRDRARGVVPALGRESNAREGQFGRRAARARRRGGGVRRGEWNRARASRSMLAGAGRVGRETQRSTAARRRRAARSRRARSCTCRRRARTSARRRPSRACPASRSADRRGARGAPRATLSEETNERTRVKRRPVRDSNSAEEKMR